MGTTRQFVRDKVFGGAVCFTKLLTLLCFRLLMGLVFMVVVWWAPSTKSDTGTYPFYFFLVVLVVYALHQVCHISLSYTLLSSNDINLTVCFALLELVLGALLTMCPAKYQSHNNC